MVPVKLQFVLRSEHRTPDGVARVRAAAAQLGIAITNSGRATVSGEIDPIRFKDLFGLEPRDLPGQPPSDADFGAGPGFEVEAEIPIPHELDELVTAIEVPRPHTRLS